MKIITNKQIEKIKALRYNDESFRKFNDPTHPDYEMYKDRQFEEWHDKGNNNCLDDVLRILHLK